MADENYKRKLTAILSADAAGYSRLMGDNEVATVSTLKSSRNLISEKVQAFNGRVVDSPGDNILSEFRSIVDAVSCAVAIQEGLREENDKLPENRRMLFRIGVNLGDVIQDGDRIYGDGVNIAARIEGLADPGGVAISGTAFDNVRNKIDCGYQFSGEHAVKNIANPVRVYKILTNPECAGKVIGEKRFLGRMSRKVAIASILSLAVIIGGLVSYYIYLHQSGRIEPASIANMAYPLPADPSIAVLPFDNMGKNSDEEYFSDGITEQIIASLSKVPYLFVVARNSTFTYKGRPVSVKQIAEELGVKYVLEGSVQRSGDRVRIIVQLIDAIDGRHIWSEKYDRQIEDIFALQDDIAMKIMAAMQVKLSTADMGRSSSIKTKNIKAYEKFLKGYEYLLSRTEGDIIEARKLAQEAIALDPDYGAPYLLLGWSYLDDVWFYRTKSVADSIDKAEKSAQKAILLSGPDAATHRLLSGVYLLRHQYDKAIEEGQRALELDPNSAGVNFIYGMVLRTAGHYREAIPVLKKAIRLNPVTPINYLNNLAWAYTGLKQYEQAIPLWNKTLERNPDYLFAYMGLTATHQLLGQESRARECAAEVIRIKPTFSVALAEKLFMLRNEEDKNLIIEALSKAGIK
jgi:adenylate cyclase